MKTRKVLMIVVLLLTVTGLAAGQSTDSISEWRTYLPFVARERSMSDWKIIVPEGAQNYVENPSGETTGNFTQLPGTVVARSTTYSFFGLYSYRVQCNANNEGISLTLSALPNDIAYVTMRVRGTLPAAWDWSLDNATYRTPTLIESIDADWDLYGVAFPAIEAVGSVALYIRQNGAGSGDFYVDAIQVESGNAYWTTYVDGDQDGCEWLGAEHASASQRSAQSRAGGRVRDLQDDYGFQIGYMIDTGLPPINLAVDSYALLPGGELNAIKVQSRTFTLTGILQGSSVANLHANRQALLDVLKPGAVPGDQPVRFRYTGAAVQKQIAAHYEGGLETSIDARLMCWERLAIRFLADDPFWYEIGESAIELDVQDAIANTDYLLGRRNGAWSNLGAVGGGTVYALAWGPDKNLYIGGSFTAVGAWGSRIVGWNPRTGAWFTLNSGATGGTVYALAFLPDGTLVAGGSFAAMDNGAGAVPNTDGIAAWDGTNWSAMGTGTDGGGTVHALAVEPTGDLLAGGDFPTMSGVANTIRVARWNGAVWAPLATGVDNTVRTIAVRNFDGMIYIGGDFNVTASYIAYWDTVGLAWTTLGSSGANNTVMALEVDQATGDLYVGGGFTTLDGVANLRIARWNETAYEQLGANGLEANVRALKMAPDGLLYIGGEFRDAGDMVACDSWVKWNSSSWAPLDVYRAAWPLICYAIEICEQDPVVSQNYDVYLGFDVGGVVTTEHAGDVTATNDGTQSAFPRLVVERDGVAGARLISLRNERAGTELLFDYALKDGEKLTVDLTPSAKSIESNFYGAFMSMILPDSDFGQFALLPGTNVISCFALQTAGTSTTGFLIWKDTFWSSD